MILLSCYVIDSKAQTKKWAVGFKVGEPTAVNLRKYQTKTAIDVSFGTYSSLLKSKKSYRDGKYAAIGMMFNASYLWFVPMAEQKVIAYGGVGAQVNIRKYYPDASKKDVHLNNVATGPSVTIGIEFFSQKKSGSFFIEGGGYLETLPKLLYFNPNLSIGLRHNF